MLALAALSFLRFTLYLAGDQASCQFDTLNGRSPGKRHLLKPLVVLEFPNNMRKLSMRNDLSVI